jgi:hypothetical protein
MSKLRFSQPVAFACLLAGLAAAGAALPVFAQSAAPAAATSGAAAGCAPDSAKQSLSDRFAGVYKDYLNWNGDPPGEGSQRKGLPDAPESSPPMPFTVWPQGGTETIGYDNVYYGPLMDAIYCGPDGQAWKDSRVTIYGWIQPGGNITTSHNGFNFLNGTGGNYPASYSYAPNTIQMDQVALYFERTPDEVQTEHFDWGFRFTPLWGTDTKYTYSRSFFSNQFTNGTGNVVKNGYDIPMAYVEGYFPGVADGLNLRIGRYVSVPDIEAQLAPNNYTYSHSLLYSYDPYTQEGVVATVRLNQNWTIQGEVSMGNDVAAWYKEKAPATYISTNPATLGQTMPSPNAGKNIGAQVTPAACIMWTSNDGRDNIYPCLNGAKPISNAGDYGWNNLQQDVVTWFHKVNDQWHIATEYWRMVEYNTPNMSNPDGQGLWNSYFGTSNSTGGPYGAIGGRGCGPADGLTCTSKEWALLNYVVYQPTPRDVFILRNEVFDDINGQRTGFPTKYFESTIAWNHWIGKAITIRPEIRLEHAGTTAFGAPYNNPCPVAGTAGCGSSITAGSTRQTMFAVDAIFHF